MTGKFYSILINSDNRVIPVEAVQNSLRTDDWLRFNFNQFFVYSDRSAQEIWTGVVATLDAADLVIVMEVVPSNGWSHFNPPLIGEWFGRVRT